MRLSNPLQLLICICAFSSCPSFGQGLWPISGTEKGSGIIGKPQQYVGNEINYSDLFISAVEGTVVISPDDGDIVSAEMLYLYSFQECVGYHFSGSWDERYSQLCSEALPQDINPRYLAGSVGIKMKDGRSLYIDGLRGKQSFKTGMKIHRGDTLGVVSYAYKAFETPHIRVCLSDQKSCADDIMAFLDIPSTFVREELVIPARLTAEQAGEDISVLMSSLKECYPSLDEILTEDEFSAFEEKAYRTVAEGISYDDFYLLVRSATSSELVHDSHALVLTENPFRAKKKYTSHLGILSDGTKLFVGQVLKGDERFLGREVASVDGETAAEVISRLRNMCCRYDSDNESIRNLTPLRAANWVYNYDYSKPKTSHIVFMDGEEYDDVWIPNKSISLVPSVKRDLPYFRNEIRAYKTPVMFEPLNDSTIYFGLGTFNLNQVQMEVIADSLKALSPYSNMVLDVRNNQGGSIDILEELVSYFISSPTSPLKSYCKVNSDSTYSSFKYSSNHAPDDVLFSDYSRAEGKDGFYDYTHWGKVIQPDSLVNYSGRLYILTDESSVSAASEFPSYLVRNGRAVTVGRETGTGYHWMNAKFLVDIVLPNSLIQVRIPLVKIVFEELETDRTPHGRGLLPDYEVPVSYEELYTSTRDVILDEALSRIAAGDYIKADYFKDEIQNVRICGWKVYIPVVLLLVFGAGIIFFVNRFRTIRIKGKGGTVY